MAENKSLFLWNGRSYSAAEFVDLQSVPEYVVAVQSAKPAGCGAGIYLRLTAV